MYRTSKPNVVNKGRSFCQVGNTHQNGLPVIYVLHFLYVGIDIFPMSWHENYKMKAAFNLGVAVPRFGTWASEWVSG